MNHVLHPEVEGGSHGGLPKVRGSMSSVIVSTKNGYVDQMGKPHPVRALSCHPSIYFLHWLGGIVQGCDIWLQWVQWIYAKLPAVWSWWVLPITSPCPLFIILTAVVLQSWIAMQYNAKRSQIRVLGKWYNLINDLIPQARSILLHGSCCVLAFSFVNFAFYSPFTHG